MKQLELLDGVGLGYTIIPRLDQNFVPALEALFQRETAHPGTHSDVECPLRTRRTFFLRPVVITCECPDSHTLVRMLGENVPKCTANKCPVRIMLPKNEG
jgi:hypothetical protein